VAYKVCRKVARCVSKQVPVNCTRMVAKCTPRQVAYEVCRLVPVTVCRPTLPCGPGCNTGCATGNCNIAPGTAVPHESKKVEPQPDPKSDKEDAPKPEATKTGVSA
jgi:hypothetical protein